MSNYFIQYQPGTYPYTAQSQQLQQPHDQHAAKTGQVQVLIPQHSPQSFQAHRNHSLTQAPFPRQQQAHPYSSSLGSPTQYYNQDAFLHNQSFAHQAGSYHQADAYNQQHQLGQLPTPSPWMNVPPSPSRYQNLQALQSPDSHKTTHGHRATTVPGVNVPPSPSCPQKTDSRQGFTQSTTSVNHQSASVPRVVVPSLQQQHHRAQPVPRVIVPPFRDQDCQTPQTLTSPLVAKQQQEAQMFVQVPVRQHVLQDVNPTAFCQANTYKSMAAQEPSIASTQYPSMLLSLADEYIEASRKLEERTEDYYKLVSTALGCMELALKNFKLAPLREAQLSLKYAQFLYDETNDLDVAESILTKAVDLCERMKFIDLKYAIQLLLARVLYRSKPRAAIRALQGMIQDVETYRHTAWEYSFRFQAVFFDMQSAVPSNLHDALQQLEKVQHTARQHADHAVYAFAAVLEALIQLTASTPDGNEMCQRALAKARSLQLNPDVDGHPQLTPLVEMIDTIWGLNTNLADESQMRQKGNNLVQAIKASVEGNKTWREDALCLRVNSSSLKGIGTQDGGLVHAIDGKHYITFMWMNVMELEAVSYLIKAMCSALDNHSLRGKVETYLSEGYSIPNGEIPNPPINDNGHQPRKPVTMKDAQLLTRSHILAAHFQAELAILSYARGNFKKVQEALSAAEDHMKKLGESTPVEITAFLEYLKGCFHHGTGNLAMAMTHYQSKTLALKSNQQNPTQNTKPTGQPLNSTLAQLQLLAAMNTGLIIRDPSHLQHPQLRLLIETISTHIALSLSPNIIPIYNLLLAILPNSTILQTKQLLSSSLEVARKIKNHQITAFALTLIQDKFFRGGVQNSQALKSAKAAAHQVRAKWGHPLWMAVAGSMEIESLMVLRAPELAEEIEKRKDEVAKAWAMVPERVRKEVQKGD